MLVATGLSKRYGELQVFSGIDLTLKAQEAVGLVGPSGAGKSTLLQLLGTLDMPDSGKLTFEGTRLDTLKPKALAHFRSYHLGFVFQFHHLLVDFSALENVAIPARLAGLSKMEANERAEQLLVQVGLSERLKHYPNELSGGEQQRVAIARALVNRPKLILADEPTGNLDETNTRKLFDILHRATTDAQAALLVATHNRHAAAGLDRVVHLEGGKLMELDPLHPAA